MGSIAFQSSHCSPINPMIGWGSKPCCRILLRDVVFWDILGVCSGYRPWTRRSRLLVISQHSGVSPMLSWCLAFGLLCVRWLLVQAVRVQVDAERSSCVAAHGRRCGSVSSRRSAG